MGAMVLEEGKAELSLQELPKPSLSANQMLIKVACCGVCRTDLHILDGHLDDPNLPLVPEITHVISKQPGNQCFEALKPYFARCDY